MKEMNEKRLIAMILCPAGVVFMLAAFFQYYLTHIQVSPSVWLIGLLVSMGVSVWYVGEEKSNVLRFFATACFNVSALLFLLVAFFMLIFRGSTN